MHEYRAGDYMDLNLRENVSLTRSAVNGEEPMHTHDFIEIVYILSGRGRQRVNGVSYEAGRGDALLIRPSQTHAFVSEGEMRYINCILLPEFMGNELIGPENASDMLAFTLLEEFGSLREGEGGGALARFRGSALIEVEALFGMMEREYREKEPGYRSALKGYCLVLLARVFRELRRDGSDVLQSVDRVSPDILRYIEENCFERVTLAQLARKCFYNPSYFSRMFKNCYGENLTDFIHSKRIDAAVTLLRTTDLPVEEICHRVGYKDKKQFYKLFRERLGETPRQIRAARGTGA